MDYQKIYDNLINKRKTVLLDENVYGENHHIVPKCMGGSNDKENLVRLTAKEHYVAHHLLYKIHGTSSLAHAWFSMVRCDPNQERYFNSAQYENARNAHSNAMKETMIGEGNHFYGRTHTEETKKKIGDKNRNRKKSADEIENWVEKVAKKKKSAEHRRKIARKGMVMLKNIHTGECVRIPIEERQNYDGTIWMIPSAISQKRESCIHCGMTSVSGNIKRWHNDNCKQKII